MDFKIFKLHKKTNDMRYKLPDKKMFIENRKKLVKLMEPGSAAFINANDLMPTCTDGTMKFRQNSDLFYLTGVDQEETVLLLYPDCPDPLLREVLLLTETNDTIMTWHGKKLSMEEATELSGIKNVLWLSEFERVYRFTMCNAKSIYLNSNNYARADVIVESRDARFTKRCQSEFPLQTYKNIAPFMEYLRTVKSKYEIGLMQKAIDITEAGFRRAMKFVKPGVMEYEVEAEFIHEFTRCGAAWADFLPIIASGEGTCVLHYIKNDEVCKDGDLLLLDLGASYAYYNADMTRTIPVNGKFSKRQRDVYNAVHRVMKKHIPEMKAGRTIQELQQFCCENIQKELVDLKLLTMNDIKNQNPAMPAFKKYFMHNISHHLGIDVHDVGDLYRKLEPGMVLSCEPGIYIREESLGIRLENDVMVTENGGKDLMKNIPIDADEIEELMNK
jgi:Xaa-Pro aminopeptidase